MNKDTAHLYLPLVQALVDGETIQLLSGKEWIDLTDFRMGETPELYRVKPKPKMSWYRVAEYRNEEGIFTVNADEIQSERDVEYSAGFVRWLTERTEFEVTECYP